MRTRFLFVRKWFCLFVLDLCPRFFLIQTKVPPSGIGDFNRFCLYWLGPLFFLLMKTFKPFGFQIFWLWAYQMKGIPESLLFCVVFYRSLFVLFVLYYLGNCVFCPSSICGLLLSLNSIIKLFLLLFKFLCKYISLSIYIYDHPWFSAKYDLVFLKW